MNATQAPHPDAISGGSHASTTSPCDLTDGIGSGAWLPFARAGLDDLLGRHDFPHAVRAQHDPSVTIAQLHNVHVRLQRWMRHGISARHSASLLCQGVPASLNGEPQSVHRSTSTSTALTLHVREESVRGERERRVQRELTSLVTPTRFAMLSPKDLDVASPGDGDPGRKTRHTPVLLSCPCAVPRSTLPLCAVMRSFSLGRLGLWSCVMSTASTAGACSLPLPCAARGGREGLWRQQAIAPN